MRDRSPRLDGFLNLNKPRGITSMEAVRRVRRATGQNHVGHGGTLDPLAEGVLPICIGQATRMMEFLVQELKGYRMEVLLGVATDTYDADGQETSRGDASGVTLEQVENVLDAFRGTFQQMPPMYSALKHRGQRLYDLAREGIEVERKPRRVHVRHLEVKAFTPPVLALEVKCGRGLYLRSLAHDIGQSLGCGAHMTALTRFQAGAFLLEASVQLDELERGAAGGGWQAHLLPLDYPLLSMKPLKVPPAAEKLLRNGQPASIGPQFAQTTHLESRRAYGLDGRFLGVLRWDRSQGVWVPDKLFHPGEPSPHAP